MQVYPCIAPIDVFLSFERAFEFRNVKVVHDVEQIEKSKSVRCDNRKKKKNKKTSFSLVMFLFFVQNKTILHFSRMIQSFLGVLMQGFVYFMDKRLIVVVKIFVVFPSSKAKRRAHTN